MDNLTKTLLTGAALSAFSVVPAMAAGHMPMVSVKTANGVISMSGVPHYKTNVNKGIHHPTTYTFTSTYYVYSYNVNSSSFYKQTVDLPAFAFYTISAGGHCVDYQPQKAKAVATGGNGKAKVYTTKQHVTLQTTSGAEICSGTLTYFGPAYELKSKTATFSSVQLNDKLTFKSNFTTTTTTTTTGVKHKQKHHKHKHKFKENFTGREVVNLHIAH